VTEAARHAVVLHRTVPRRTAPSLPAALFDLSRGKQALLTIAQPALGVVLAMGGLPPARVIVIGLPAAAAGSFAMYALNDLLDRRIDTRAVEAGSVRTEGDMDTAFVRHPLAHGAVSLRASVMWVAGLAAIAAVGVALLNPLCLVFFAAAVALQALYCALRSVTCWKTLAEGAMEGCGGLAGWVAVAPLGRGALAVFGFLALWEIGGRNIAHDLSDLESDASLGIRTVAAVYGPAAAAHVTAVAAAATLGAVALLPMPLPAVLLALAFGAWALVAPAVALVRRPTPAQALAYFNRGSLFPDLVLFAALVGLLAAK
jgi:4-hydroxybenzoate polyprenyltransferase